MPKVKNNATEGQNGGMGVQYSLRLLIASITIVCIVLAILRVAPSWAILILCIAMSILFERIETRMKDVDAAAIPIWYRIGRRVWYGFAGMVDGAIVGVVLAIVLHNALPVDVDLVRAAFLGAGFGGALGAVYPHVIASVGIPLY